jgi:hypothetical protein
MAAHGAQQAFSVCSRKVSDAPIPAVRVRTIGRLNRRSTVIRDCAST